MAISFKQSGGGEDALLSEINTTPLVDVMLVLLIIFLITIPAVNTSVAVALPRQANQIRETRPENIIISVDPSGATYWADTRMPDAQTLQSRLKAASTQNPQPEVHIRGDARASYDAIGRIVYACQQAGITRIGFITEPPAGQPR